MKTIKINTAELSGAALDFAVAVAIGKQPVLWDACCGDMDWQPAENRMSPFISVGADMAQWSPSTEWSQGGPLIEKYDVWLSSDAIPGPWLASINGCGLETGPTPLIAACRAIVYDKLGGTVDVPAELVEAAP